ncbi:MAG: hypothetical protein ACK4IS_06480 [Erythrobacter sp.]
MFAYPSKALRQAPNRRAGGKSAFARLPAVRGLVASDFAPHESDKRKRQNNSKHSAEIIGIYSKKISDFGIAEIMPIISNCVIENFLHTV